MSVRPALPRSAAPYAAAARRLSPLLVAATLTACIGRPAAGEGVAAAERRPTTVIIIPGRSFEGRDNLVAVLSARVGSLQVNRGGACPELVFRGRSSLQGSSSARVYVDGQPAVNTCVLEMISTWDIARVEVYPSGIVRRAGYGVSGTGAILVFTKSAGLVE
jgi:hypothetical protein